MMTETGELATIVGEDNVQNSMEVLHKYSRDRSFVPSIKPDRVVKPTDPEQVQRIVQWANKTDTSLIPVSSGAPHFHGGTVPGIGGACIVDLCAMKRVLHVDRRNRSAMIEPGVTFGELIPALEKEGLAPLMPLLPSASKSVVASFLERTPITIPRHHWEPQDPLQCVEVIYGNGELMRTGSAAGPGTVEEQRKVGRAQVRGMGPSQVDFTRLLQGAQGTMGIVTWATIRCRPLPKVKKSFVFASNEIQPLIELVYGITYKKLGEELLIINRNQMARIIGKGSFNRNTFGGETPEWVLFCSIEGDGLFPEDKVAYQEIETIRLAKELGLSPESEAAGIRPEDLSFALSRPSREPYWKLEPQGGSQDIFFLTTLDKSPRFIDRMRDLADTFGYPPDDMGVYLQPTLQGCNAHVEFSLGYNPENQPETAVVRRLVEEGSAAMSGMGGFFSRPYGTWSEFAYDRGGMHIMGQRKLKKIFDPGGIMNPGKLCF